MINSKKELHFYVTADRIMNGLSSRLTAKLLIYRALIGGGTTAYLEAMRKYSYYKHCRGFMNRFKRLYWGNRFRKLGLKYGYSINEDVFGYGLVIPHYGTIVVGPTNVIGNYAVLHTSTCISAKESIIGDGLYLSTGAKITKQVKLGNGVMIAANSVVNESFGDNCLIAGMPAKLIGSRSIWYNQDGEENYRRRVSIVEGIKNKYQID